MRSGNPGDRGIARSVSAATGAMLLAWLTAPAFAQTLPSTAAQTAAKSGAWETRCESPPGVQTIVDHDRPNLSLVAIALKTADRKSRLLRVIVPLGSLIPTGLGLHIDADDLGRISYVKCLPTGCVAEVFIEDKVLKAMEAGKKVTFVVFETPEEGIGVSGSLAGFKEAFEALP